jgi:ABC-type nickel/cobalt efflux system permease component RcnA
LSLQEQAMKLPDGMRKHGFRKWYERQLIQSHGHLVMAFICLIGIFAAMEAFSGQLLLADRLFDVGAVLLLSGIGLWALRRYLFLLGHAEATAHQAVCPGCQAYGRFNLVAEDAAGQRITVRCRACEREWPIEH